MAIVIVNTESEERKAEPYQEAEVATVREEHLKAESYEVGFALMSILALRELVIALPVPPLHRPCTFLRVYGIYSRYCASKKLKHKPSCLHLFRRPATVILYIGARVILWTHEEERKVVRAADFPSKAARREQHKSGSVDRYLDTILEKAEDLSLSTKRVCAGEYWYGL
jgi:hypothetical protein